MKTATLVVRAKQVFQQRDGHSAVCLKLEPVCACVQKTPPLTMTHHPHSSNRKKSSKHNNSNSINVNTESSHFVHSTTSAPPATGLNPDYLSQQKQQVSATSDSMHQYQNPPGTPTSKHLLSCLHELISIASQYYKLDFSQTPLLKPLLLLSGAQSSGKSSIINYLYSMSLRRVGEQAVDEKFSIIECISEREFLDLASQSAKRDIHSSSRQQKYKDASKFNFKSAKDMHWLMKPRPENASDEREGVVWYKLTPLQTMQRYKQFYENSELGEILRSHNLLEGIVVNDKFVRGTELNPDEKPIARDVILIDTPGINDESVGSLNKFRAYIRVLEFFYKQAQYCFFVSDPSHLRSIGNALHMLELTIADADTKQKVFETVGKEIAQRNSSRGLDSSQRGASSTGATAPSSGISFSLSNLIVDVAASALHRTVPFLNNAGNTSTDLKPEENDSDFRYVGASLYEKLYFIINKADKIRSLPSAFFEFGLSMGRNIQHFPLPHSNRVLAIALPMEQRFQMHRYGYSVDEQADLKKFEKLFESMRWDGRTHGELVVAQLADLENILSGLRGEHTKKQCLLFYIDFVYRSIQNARQGDSNYFSSTFRRLKHYYTEPWSRAQALYKEVLSESGEGGVVLSGSNGA
mmetsp:Transcript_10906/g.40664  ORF Transcript_10906/g.40664 Transcript_10906/m.40664 type:complete len:637 (-) Transcript_10906:85-1995(-)